MPKITVPARLENLTVVQEYLRSTVPEAFKNQIDNIALVSEELLVNVFSYAYPNGTTGEATVEIHERGHGKDARLEFLVQHWGSPFNPFAQAKTPNLTLDLESRPIGGLGIYLIKQVSKAQNYEYVDGVNNIYVYFEVKR